MQSHPHTELTQPMALRDHGPAMLQHATWDIWIVLEETGYTDLHARNT
jgi:hypothetical protein